MNRLSFKEWFVLVISVCISFALWFKFSYPQFSFVDLSVDRHQAIAKAESFLQARGVATDSYLKAVVFSSDDWADRYLQKTIGQVQEKNFIEKYDYELFSWQIRFFREFQKEEYIVEISSRSGKVISFLHLIEDIAPREPVEKEIARINAEGFLRENFSVNFDDYDFHEEKTQRYEQRTDYNFSWERKGVYIPWKENEGGAKLLIGVTVSGNEIRKFSGGSLDIPEKFHRYIERQMIFGEYLFSLYFIMFAFLIAQSIIVITRRRHDILSRACGKWYAYVAGFIITISLLSFFNNIQNIINGYPTSVSLLSFLFIYLIKVLINLTIFCAIIILPGLAGEVLRSELFPQKQFSSFAHYLRACFYSRNVARAVIFGYCVFFVMLGAQSLILHLGQKYFGVWKEWFNLTQFSSANLPFFSAFVIAATAGINEEILFRLFGITWAKKYFKNVFLAVLFASVIWGFGHSQYAVFPVWFRGVEVSVLGLFLGFIFLKYGIIPVIVAHYLFNAFWGVSAYILGKSNYTSFYGSIFVLSIPILFALFAFFVNREDKEKELKGILNEAQKFNLAILITFVSAKKAQGSSAEMISRELIAHHWDIELIKLAIEEVFK